MYSCSEIRVFSSDARRGVLFFLLTFFWRSVVVRVGKFVGVGQKFLKSFVDFFVTC